MLCYSHERVFSYDDGEWSCETTENVWTTGRRVLLSWFIWSNLLCRLISNRSYKTIIYFLWLFKDILSNIRLTSKVKSVIFLKSILADFYNKKLRQVIKPSKYQWNKIQANVIKQNLSCLLICDNKIKTIFVEMYNINTMWKINVYFFLLLSSFQPHRTFMMIKDIANYLDG